jgi:hypothetical protein
MPVKSPGRWTIPRDIAEVPLLGPLRLTRRKAGFGILHGDGLIPSLARLGHRDGGSRRLRSGVVRLRFMSSLIATRVIRRGRLGGPVGCAGDGPALLRSDGGWIGLLAPDEPAGADLDPGGGGRLGDDPGPGSPPRPRRRGRGGSRLIGGRRHHLAGSGRFRPGNGADPKRDGGLSRAGVRHIPGAFRNGIASVLVPCGRREQVPADQRQVGEQGRQKHRGDRSDGRGDEEGQDSGPGYEDRANEASRRGW